MKKLLKHCIIEVKRLKENPDEIHLFLYEIVDSTYKPQKLAEDLAKIIAERMNEKNKQFDVKKEYEIWSKKKEIGYE